MDRIDELSLELFDITSNGSNEKKIKVFDHE